MRVSIYLFMLFLFFSCQGYDTPTEKCPPNYLTCSFIADVAKNTIHSDTLVIEFVFCEDEEENSFTKLYVYKYKNVLLCQKEFKKEGVLFTKKYYNALEYQDSLMKKLNYDTLLQEQKDLISNFFMFTNQYFVVKSKNLPFELQNFNILSFKDLSLLIDLEKETKRKKKQNCNASLFFKIHYKNKHFEIKNNNSCSTKFYKILDKLFLTQALSDMLSESELFEDL